MNTLKDGEWVAPIRRGFQLGCCDCGLIHDMDFRVNKGVLRFRMTRNKRATNLRRKKIEQVAKIS